MLFDEVYRRILNRLDYYNYQHGFIVRHMNQGAGWSSHLEKCRNFILKAVEAHKPETVTVLGSGWLLELPLAEMLEKVSKVNLVDIIHPPGVIEQTAGLKGVELITADISGGLIDEVWKKSSRIPFFKKNISIRSMNIPEYKPDFDTGMVISLNILTQLEILPLRHLEKKTKVNKEEINRLRIQIQDNHISLLKKNRSILITDVAEIYTDKQGNVSEKKTVITVLPEGKYSEEWTWDFDLKGSDYYGKRSVFKVKAIVI